MINLSKNKAATADTYLDGTKPIAKQSKKDLESQLFNIRVELMERDRMEKEAQAKAKRAAERRERQPDWEWYIIFPDSNGVKGEGDTDYIGGAHDATPRARVDELLAEYISDPLIIVELKRFPAESNDYQDIEYVEVVDGEIPVSRDGRYRCGEFIVPKTKLNQLKRAKAMAKSI
tara:strand:+ start:264 stop:788 length:525 start_codon:yes stop_codon:yes gene_type:complete